MNFFFLIKNLESEYFFIWPASLNVNNFNNVLIEFVITLPTTR